jgi:glycerol uptake facilitator-like aquaporin
MSIETLCAVRRPDLLRRCVAEGLAALSLVVAGWRAIVTDVARDEALGVTGVAAVFGLVVMVMFYATGHLSGARINTSVTIAFGGDPSLCAA